MVKLHSPQIELNKFPRVELLSAPTPLQRLAGLSAQFAPHNLFIKRDDCTTLAGGGNKARQLEFYLGAALAEKADCILSTGAVQSNHLRMLAAACARLGLACHVQLENRMPDGDEDYHRNGNVFLDKLFGAQVYHFDGGDDEDGADAAMQKIAAQLKSAGKRPYLISLKQEKVYVGALGYVAAAVELANQIQGLKIDAIAVASGSGATHAGLLVGLQMLGVAIPIIGVCVRRSSGAQSRRIQLVAEKLCAELNAGSPPLDAIHTDDLMLAPGYGQASPAVVADLNLLAGREGILTDPVYSAKVIAWILQKIRAGEMRYKNILFIHTGGVPALFAYQKLFA